MNVYRILPIADQYWLFLNYNLRIQTEKCLTTTVADKVKITDERCDRIKNLGMLRDFPKQKNKANKTYT